jgi:hypothetical protein
MLGPISVARVSNVNKHDILSIVDVAGDGIVTTAAPHELTGSETITLTGCGVHNGAFSIVGGDANVTGAKTIQLVGAGFGASTFGGRWD